MPSAEGSDPASTNPARDLHRLLEAAGPEGASEALSAGLVDLGQGPSLPALRVQFARLGRTVPRTDLEAHELAWAYPGIDEPRFYQADVLARIVYLLSIEEVLGREQSLEAISVLYRTGSSREQASVLRALPWLSNAALLAPLASEAARTNDIQVFAALCIENPFPAKHLADDAFFQVVMKSMFLEQETARILGLSGRVNPELLRMATDYRKEREAAGRAVPPGVTLIERFYGKT